MILRNMNVVESYLQLHYKEVPFSKVASLHFTHNYSEIFYNLYHDPNTFIKESLKNERKNSRKKQKKKNRSLYESNKCESYVKTSSLNRNKIVCQKTTKNILQRYELLCTKVYFKFAKK